MLKKLFSRRDISAAVKRLARSIQDDFPGEELLFICLLKGSFVFTADIIREVKNDSKIDFLRVYSYGKRMKSKGKIAITKDLEEDIRNKNVIILEDIIDSGLTLKAVKEMLEKRKPKNIRICALIDKKVRREVEIEGDYIGFTIEDGFVVGYGIDYAEQYRNCPDIYVIEKEAE